MGDKLVEGLAQFKYLVRPLDQIYDNCPAICQNIKRTRKAWGRPGNILGREEAYTQVTTMLYKELVQAILIFGSELWVMLSDIERTV